MKVKRSSVVDETIPAFSPEPTKEVEKQASEDQQKGQDWVDVNLADEVKPTIAVGET